MDLHTLHELADAGGVSVAAADKVNVFQMIVLHLKFYCGGTDAAVFVYVGVVIFRKFSQCTYSILSGKIFLIFNIWYHIFAKKATVTCIF